ncbi:hypothetical protein JCM11641_004760 [Rhodosporidiobolus odoratus]
MTGLRPPSTPRASLLPTPGSTPSQLPTSRRKSAIQRPLSAQAFAVNEMSSLRQAISANDPASYASPTAEDPDSPFAVGIALGGHPHEGSSGSEKAQRQAVLPGAIRGGSRAGSSAGNLRVGTSSATRPLTPSGPHTPKTPSYTRSRTPTGFGSSTSRSTGPLPITKPGEPPALAVGADVDFEVAGEKMEGVLRFLGEIEGKAGSWAGVELNNEWAGRGKNDGSVAGVQYFACPPACGLFLAVGKVTAKPRPKPQSNPPLAGSRAAKYAGMSAKDLASRRLSAATSATPVRATPRRSLSPVKPSSASSTKPRTSLSPTKRLSASTTSMATPKPTTRLGRPSLGGAMSTPTTARKSIGGPSGTPRAAMGPSSIKRPPSSLRQNSVPDVPAIPSAYGLARSVTPSSMSGRITPSTPGGMPRRRTSLAQSESSARPTTPSVRSYSRQSFASSVSRQSHRSTASTSHAADAEELAELKADLEDARQRESETRQLLEGSEKLGREMEDRLGDKAAKLEEAEERIALLEKERERAKQDEEARLAGVEGSEGDLEREKLRARELETRLAELEKSLEVRDAAVEKLRREEKHKSAAKEAEAESLRERLDRAGKAHDEERERLESNVAQLRTAGQALCETYEERIAEIELAKLEAVEELEVLRTKLDGTSAVPSATQTESSPLSRSLGHSHTSSAADIDAENAQAEVEHLRGRIAHLEEQLEDARMQVEAEIAEAAKRRERTKETESVYKGEIKALKEAIERSAKAESRSAARVQELQEALLESQSTLEAERSELEGLRHETNGDATASLADDLKRVHKDLATTRLELEKAQRDATLVAELREDLRNAEKEIERLAVSVVDGQKRSSIGGKDEATASREQIVGLKSIVATLTEENQTLLEKNQSTEQRADELSDSQKALEATIENLMTQLSSDPSAPPTTATTVAESSTLRRELEQLRTELKEVQRKSEREIKALNQEVTELESLVESKIYREDELETELEKYKALATSSSNSGSHTNGHSKKSYAASETDGEQGDGECEMCGEKGHDLDSCPDFSSSPTKSSAADRRASRIDAKDAADYCDDCEEYGHSLENCPLAAEIF